jgi:hypothetical protein
VRIIAKPINASTKTLKIGARVTPEQKAAVMERMKELGYQYESDYVLHCCLKGCNITSTSEYQLELLKQGSKDRLDIRVTEGERKKILQRFSASKMNNFSRFVRNCCFDNPIIVVEGMKECAGELNHIGHNLNQLTMLCHQGLITTPDLTEVKEDLKKIYQEVVAIKLKHRLKR